MVGPRPCSELRWGWPCGSLPFSEIHLAMLQSSEPFLASGSGPQVTRNEPLWREEVELPLCPAGRAALLPTSPHASVSTANPRVRAFEVLQSASGEARGAVNYLGSALCG